MQIRSFADFWPFYVRAHSKPLTRTLHAIGSVLALICVVAAVFVSRWFLAAALLLGYGFAWFAHFVIEGNRPATFGHPFYSLAADYVMLWRTLTGTMAAEVRKHCSKS
jgi:hypothetical protein